MKMRKSFLCLILCLVMAVNGCGLTSQNGKDNSQTPVKTEIFAMDTIMDFTVYGSNAQELITEARNMVTRYESLFSVNIETSDVSKLNHANGKAVQVSDETYDLLKKSIEISNQTKGLFDVSIFPLVRAWGFTTDQYRVPSTDERKKILKDVDYTKIQLSANHMVTLPDGMEVDLGGIAKGYLSEKITELFKSKQVEAAILSLGGNVQTCGEKPDGSAFQVGITDPKDGTSVLGTIEVGEKAVITSGSYQRYFEKDGNIYHHIMDKRTGAPAESDLKSVTVIADRGESADSYATALFVMGKEKAIQFAKTRPEIKLILIDENDEVWTSDGLKFTNKE